ncbi:MAG: putative toxin-antitoxin system toxin component, PIN family [Desulfococcaceae bacterium]
MFVSGLFSRDSISGRLMDLWVHESFALITSVEILKEVVRVLICPRIREHFPVDDEIVRRFFRLVFRKAVISRDRYRVDRLVDDPDDNKFLACALEMRADFIVSRYPHLRNLKHFHGIQIVDAAAFIEEVTQPSPRNSVRPGFPHSARTSIGAGTGRYRGPGPGLVAMKK